MTGFSNTADDVSSFCSSQYSTIPTTIRGCSHIVSAKFVSFRPLIGLNCNFHFFTFNISASNLLILHSAVLTSSRTTGARSIHHKVRAFLRNKILLIFKEIHICLCKFWYFFLLQNIKINQNIKI